LCILLPASGTLAQTAPPAGDLAGSARIPVGGLYDSLALTTVGLLDQHELFFTLPDTLPVDASLRVTFPSGFPLDSVTTAFYGDNDTANTDPVVSGVGVIDNSVTVFLDSSGTPAAAGSTLSIRISKVRNGTVAGAYQVALAIYAADTTLLFGPTLSEPFTLSPDSPQSMVISPDTAVTVVAGATHLFNSSVYDQYGNTVDSATRTYRVVPDSLGVFAGPVFSARRSGVGNVIAESGNLADTSAAITVTAGPLARWDVAGFPASVVAGQSLGAGSVTVTARDAFDNRKRDFTGAFYFTATDSIAILPATQATPRNFTLADSGRVAFAGSAFRFYKAGPDTVRSIGGGATAQTLIEVLAAAASNFAVHAPDSVTAGKAFTVIVDSAVDLYGNVAAGTVQLQLNPGDSASPGGQAPVLPAVAVAGGTGSASVTLTNAGRYPLLGRIASLVRTTDSLTIRSAPPARFDWLLSGPQVSGVPFSPVATLTAYDPYGNLSESYDPGGTPVEISALNGDSMSNNVLGPGTFTGGVADLSVLEVTYHGRGGEVRFAAGAGPAVGTSEPVSVIALGVDTLSLDQTLVRRGVDTLTGTVHADINGSGSVTITGIELIIEGTGYPLSNVSPPLPNSVSGPASSAYTFRWPVPGTLAEGCRDIDVRVFGDFSAAAISADFTNAPCVTVTSGADPAVVSLLPDTVAYAPVEYRLTLGNNGPLDITANLDSTVLIVTDGTVSDTARSVASGETLIPDGGQINMRLRTQHLTAFAGDSAAATLRIVGTETGKRVEFLRPAAAPLFFQSPASIQYVAGSALPDTLLAGRADTLRIRIANTGAATVRDLGPDSIYLVLSGPVDTMRLSLIPALTPLDVFPPGDTALAFALSEADSRVDVGVYNASLYLNGTQNYRAFRTVETLTDPLVFAAPARVRIDSLWATAPNLPYVSTTQSLTLHAAVTNTGGEIVDSLQMRLTADGGALFTDTLSGPSLDPGASAEFVWPVTADVSPFALETFGVAFVRAVGRVTGGPAAIDPPLDAQASIQVQSPASLAADLRISGPPEAADLRVAAGSEFIVAGRFVNSGQASTGPGDLQITADAGATILDPVVQTADPLGEVTWRLTAPAADTTISIVLSFASVPNETNTSAPSAVTRGADTLLMEAVFETPPLIVFDPQFQSGLLTQELAPVSFAWRNDDPSGAFPILLQRCDFVLETPGGVPLDAADLVTSATLDVDGQLFTASLSTGVIRFGGDSLLRINPGDTGQVALTFTPRPATTIGEFRIATDALLWSALERSVDGAGLPVTAVDPSGRPLDLSGPVLYRSGAEPSCYPNPFRAGSEPVRVQYRLAGDAAVDINIYTAAGLRVWSEQYSAGGRGGRAGDNEITWDGHNGRGHVVFDGVYFMHISGGGLDQTLKIVVMK